MATPKFRYRTRTRRKIDRQIKALMAQTEEDFTRILTLHNEIARRFASKPISITTLFPKRLPRSRNARAVCNRHSLCISRLTNARRREVAELRRRR